MRSNAREPGPGAPGAAPPCPVKRCEREDSRVRDDLVLLTVDDKAGKGTLKLI